MSLPPIPSWDALHPLIVHFPIALLLAPCGVAARALVAAAVVVVALPVVARFLRGRDVEDPQEVVLDELAGMLVAVAFVPVDPLWILGAFLLFRLLDITKPGPIGWFERRTSGSVSVVGDDVLAGAAAGGLLLALRVLGASFGWWT